ncbi:16S rRNA (guanine(966)-N(2))-methyltransferase RsmD [Candidatus Uabimicrobium sp. HlEnr_7]|uniref:16S rRNA (guanine(966)-N(2))-methyltransferase RsmD n=1 Tax=Candidatus Uabimicrobium helgolandensis TaxID=3095367 RepID=UPI003557B81C
MRICSGSIKGMNLNSPKGMKTRPMIERVKLALFNIIGEEIHGAKVLDCFSGSGALGLEALSRGAVECHFVENGRHVLPVLKANIEKSKFTQWKLTPKSAFFVKKSLPEQHFDIVLMDPPYKYIDHPCERKETLEFISELMKHACKQDSLVILHCRRHAMAGSPIPKSLELESKREYGSSELWFLRKV